MLLERAHGTVEGPVEHRSWGRPVAVVHRAGRNHGLVEETECRESAADLGDGGSGIAVTELLHPGKTLSIVLTVNTHFDALMCRRKHRHIR
jgi:hypothetical protein